MAAYLDDMPLRSKPKHPGSAMIASVRNVVRYFGDTAHQNLTRDACRDYRSHRLAHGVSDSTIKRELSFLRAGVRWAYPQSPATFDLPLQSPPLDRVLTDQEISALMAYWRANTPHAYVAMQLAWCTLARIGAVLEMTWDTHVNFDALDGTGTVWPGFREGGKARAKPVPMTTACRDALIVARDRAQTPYVVEYNGQPVKRISKALRAGYAHCGIQGVSKPAHIFRHTGATVAAMRGVPMRDIQMRLGHTSIATTERHYAHAHPDYVDSIKSVLDGYK